jgi:predicted ATP-binding protein involved in virulence
MQIKAFEVYDLGPFEVLDTSFTSDNAGPANVIVLVGNNGAGKTSVLKALATSLSWFPGRLRGGKGSGSPIPYHAIRRGAASAAIKLTVSDTSAGQKDFHWTVARSRQGMKAEHVSALAGASLLADHYRSQLTVDEKCSLPLLAFYPVERLVMGAPLKVNARNAFDQMAGYEDFLSPTVNFAGFFEWFRDREDYENERYSQVLNSDNKGDQLRRWRQIAAVLNNHTVDEGEALDVEAIRAQLNKIEAALKNVPLVKQVGQQSSQVPADTQLSAVRSAIEQFMPGFSNLRVQRKPYLQLMVDKGGVPLDILQLSQGEKTLMALVGDIARRLAMVNPALDNPLHGRGIVLIDEVDMHLHPNWQREIIRNLIRTFPHCQFILSTHSPLVISDYQDVLVFALNDGHLDKVPSQFGQDANTVLLDVMDTHVRNAGIGEQLNDTLDAIQTGRLDDARQIIQRLESQLPSSNLELAKAKLFLRKQELRLEKNH